MTTRHTQFLVASSVSLAAFAIYLATLCPTLDFIDAGELSTVCATLGIAHPTGYPLFTLVGWLFAHLPISARIISRLNVMPAVECSLALFFFFQFLLFFLNEFSLARVTEEEASGIRVGRSKMVLVVPALCGTLVLAFSETFWAQALSIEVYSLHTLFLSILLLVYTSAISADARLGSHADLRELRRHRMLWFGFAYVLGLAFTNHMTTILLAPAFLFLYFYVNRFSSASFRKLMSLAAPFLLGLSLYLYVVIRAGGKPTMNWGNPISLERLYWHFSGKQYRVWLFSSTEAASKQMQYFLNTFLPEFGYLPVILAAAGLWRLFSISKPMFTFTLLLFLGCVLYSINYDIHDIDSYFLLAYVTSAIWCAHGAMAILAAARSLAAIRWRSTALVAACCIPLFYNYVRVDESRNVVVEEYTRNMFSSVGQNAVIFSYQWDYFVSASNYLQTVEHVRPDVVVIDKELMRRSWYYVQLESRYPWLLQQSRKEVREFLVELSKFEHDEQYDARVIEFRYAELIRSIIRKNIDSRPVYVTYEIEPQYLTGYQRVPSGLAFRLYADSVYHEAGMPDLAFRPPFREDTYTSQIATMYAQAYTNRAIYLASFQKNAESEPYLEKALEIVPGYAPAKALKMQISGQK